VHGDGLDELTTAGKSLVAQLKNGEITTFEVEPEQVGLSRARMEDLRGGDGAHNAQALRAVLAGEKSAYRDISLLNAAGALVVAERAKTLQEAIALAADSIDSGAALERLEKLIEVSRTEVASA